MNPHFELILLVEDDPHDATLIQRAIKKANILNPVRVLTDGEAAIDYFSGTPPYEDREKHPLPVLTLLDLKLPRKSGLEVLEVAKTISVVRRIPIVVLTSSNQSADINRAYELGTNSYLVKPVSTDALVDLLKTIEVYWLMTNQNPDVNQE